MQTTPNFIRHLTKALQTSLPGKDAQFQMAALNRPSYNSTIREDVRQAAVLINLFQRESEWKTLIMRRRIVDGDRHSGQISFPGGKRENDESLSQTAIRESHEEVGTPLNGVQILGPLSPLHIPISNFVVQPFLGYLEAPSNLVRQESEVESIHEIALTDVFNPDLRKKRDLKIPEGLVLRDVPYFDLDGQTVWGATAMIMSEFIALVDRSDSFASM